MEERRTLKVIFLSILLHLLLLLLWEGGYKLNFFKDEPMAAPPPEETPIVFNLQQPNPLPAIPEKQNQPREVIATPDDAIQQKPKTADFLSDKNALARNPETNPNLKIGDAFSRGILNTHDLPTPRGPVGQPQPQPQPQPQLQKQPNLKEKTEPLKNEKPDPKEKVKKPTQEQKTTPEMELASPLKEPQTTKKSQPTAESLMVENSSTAFYKEFVLKRPNTMNPGITQQLPGITHNNQDSRAEDMGGLSFNTYNWDFAPYLLMLKNRIQQNIFPPVAFTQLGLIDGETLIRFKIYPNGRMTDLVVLQYIGHDSLRDTSYKAVQISAPFPPLPKDFPEPYLEVTGKFMYVVRR